MVAKFSSEMGYFLFHKEEETERQNASQVCSVGTGELVIQWRSSYKSFTAS